VDVLRAQACRDPEAPAAVALWAVEVEEHPDTVPEGGEPVTAGLAGTIFKVLVAPGQQVAEGDVLMVLEAMKMETEISAPRGGTVGEVAVKEGDSVAVGETLLTLS
jgi:oxaloacetate decarboxylase alpha subunit